MTAPKKQQCLICQEWFDPSDMVGNICTTCYAINIETDDDIELDEEYDDFE